MKNHHPLTALAALMLALALTLTGCGAELPDPGMMPVQPRSLASLLVM